MQQNQSVFVSSWQVLRLTMRWWRWKESKSSFSSSWPTSKSSMIMICKKTRKYLYLGNLSPKWKNNSTLFPSTFKVEENKVPLFFHFESKRPRYGHFVIFSSFILKQMMIKTSKWRYLGDWSPNWKNNSTL